MKLVGYIKEFKECMLTIPVYSDGKNYYYHMLDDCFRVIGFSKINNLQYYLPIRCIDKFTYGSVGAVVFIGLNNHIIAGKANKVIYNIKKYLQYNTKPKEYLFAKEEISDVEDEIKRKNN